MQVLSPLQQQRRSCRNLAIGLLLAVIIIGGGGVAIAYSVFGGKIFAANNGGTPTPGKNSGIAITTTSTNESIGISDGSYAFDTQGRSDASLKLAASDKFRNGDVSGAEALWKQAIAKDTNDAEVLIYLENQVVRASHHPYVILVVGTALTGSKSNVGSGRDNLQGAYVAQKQFNDAFNNSNSIQVILWIANAGGVSDNTTTVAKQIVTAAKQDKHIVGVMGWPFSSYALKAVDVLANANIPMVSPTASSDSLTGISNFFFRVVPPNNSQVITGVHYAENTLHAHSAVLFRDPNDAYSDSLASDFRQKFIDDGNTVLTEESYTVGKPNTLPALLQDALAKNPDLIYFAGYSSDMSTLLTSIASSQSTVPIMGGDALYILNGYSLQARPVGFARLYFTAFTYPDIWDNMGLTAQKPAFFTLYTNAFNPQGIQPAGAYGFSRPDNDAIMSYDATLALLQGCNLALASTKNALTPQTLQHGLTQINSAHPIQGASGQISFGPDGNPINKVVVMLYVDSGGHIKLSSTNGIQGCLRPGSGSC